MDVYQTVDRLKWLNCGDTNTVIRLNGEKWDLPTRLVGEAGQLSRDLISGGRPLKPFVTCPARWDEDLVQMLSKGCH